MGLDNAAANGMTPKTILMSLKDKPICLACNVINGYSPHKPTK